MKHLTACACPCECVRNAYKADFCEWCSKGEHWDPRFALDWGIRLAAAVITIMAVVLVIWLATGAP